MQFDWRQTDRLVPPEGALPPMQQHRAYARTCTALGARAVAFALRDERGTLAAAQVLVRRWPLLGDFALLSRGPLWRADMPAADRSDALVALIGLLARRFRGVMTTPDRCDGVDLLAETPLLPMVSGGHMARLDLTGDVAARRARQSGKWRNRLVRAEGAGLRVVHAPMPDDPRHWLLREEAAQSRRRRYGRLPPAFTLAWIRRNGAGAARLFTAERNGRPAAAMLFLLHGPTASYHVGWSGDAGRATGAHNLLLWQAGEWLTSRGIAALDLGTLDTEGTPGLARFKLGSGADPVALGATRMAAPGTAAIAWVGRRLGAGGELSPPTVEGGARQGTVEAQLSSSASQ